MKFLPYTARMWLNLIRSKAFRSNRSQMSHKVGVLKNFAKIHRKTPMLGSLFNKVAHVLSYDVCGILKNTYFLITLQNQTTLLRKQISKVITDIVALVFIAILQNIFRSWAIIFFSKSKGGILDELDVSFKCKCEIFFWDIHTFYVVCLKSFWSSNKYYVWK